MSHGSRLLALLGASALSLPVLGAPADGLTIDTLLDIRHPVQSRLVARRTRDRVRLGAGGRRGRLRRRGSRPGAPRRSPVTRPAWWTASSGARTARSVYFERAGDLWRVPRRRRRAAARVWTTPEAEGSGTVARRRRVAFSRDGDLFVRGLADGRETRAHRDTEAVESGPAWSPDDQRLAFGSFTV